MLKKIFKWLWRFISPPLEAQIAMKEGEIEAAKLRLQKGYDQNRTDEVSTYNMILTSLNGELTTLKVKLAKKNH